MQYFLGLEKYQEEPLFDPSLLVHFRERMGKEIVDEMNGIVVVKAIKESAKKEKQKTKKKNRKDQGQQPKKENDLVENKTEEINASTDKEPTAKENAPQEEQVTHQGYYILDSTIADQYIKYPTDVDLLDKSRQKSEEIIDILYVNSGLRSKPRTYKKVARTKYLDFSKRKNKTAKQVRKARKQQLSYLDRNIRAIETFLQSDNKLIEKLDKRTYRTYLVIQEIYRQQKFMHDNNVNRCDNRIVSIEQPHVRPMVRGKQGKNVEFGSKVLAGITEDGYTLIPEMEWDQYNEGNYVIAAVEDHKNKLGYYPQVVIGDRIFVSRANQLALEKLGIRLSGKSLGRKNHEKKEEEIKQLKEEQKQRVKIEGKFGQGKNGYELNKIRMRKSSTSESMVYMIFFVMNLVRYAKEVLFWPFLQTAKLPIFFLKELLPPSGFRATLQSGC
ncbi:MAG: transposase [Ignavibacteriaceae bacterium]|nr:transposase [Ignavibacteriaceae bacterium]